MKVTAVELSEDEIEDIMDRAPQACSYWATTSFNKRSSSMLNMFHEDGTTVLGPIGVRAGVCLAMTHSSYVAKQVADHDDLGFVDIPAVDIIVQYGLFGKLVYG